jgi:hypothetical protein
MTSKLRYYLFLLITGLGIGFFLATKDRIFVESGSAITHEEILVDRNPEEVPRQKDNTPTPPPPTPSIFHSLPCTDSEFDLTTAVNDIADRLEAQKILYNSKPLSDCSGIFLRFCQALRDRCPEADFPQPREARDGRRLAQWYFDRDRLTLIQDARGSSKFIKPGAVMFYGRQNKTYQKVTIENITAASGIEHIGIVTAVIRNKKGAITNYTLFHGRSRGKIASRTTHHQRNPSQDDIPAYGNWNQQWVAVGNLME